LTDYVLTPVCGIRIFQQRFGWTYEESHANNFSGDAYLNNSWLADIMEARRDFADGAKKHIIDAWQAVLDYRQKVINTDKKLHPKNYRRFEM
jgi:hypothetical protein